MSATYLTVRDVAERFVVSVRTVERWISRGELSAVALGPKLTRIRPTDLEAFEARLCLTTASNDQASTESAASGTSSGRKVDARVVNLRARRTS